MTEADYDYDQVFNECSLFHICGISFGLSESLTALCFRLLKEAKKRNIPVSFDFNYRAKLWSIEAAAKVYKEVVKDVDILFGSQRDLTTFLGLTDREFHASYPGKYLILREREVGQNGKHTVFIRALYREAKDIKEVTLEPKEFTVFERIGSGDAFVAGVLHRLMKDTQDVKTALEYGRACFILKHSIRGDVFTLDEDTVKSYMKDLSKDVSR